MLQQLLKVKPHRLQTFYSTQAHPSASGVNHKREVPPGWDVMDLRIFAQMSTAHYETVAVSNLHGGKHLASSRKSRILSTGAGDQQLSPAGSAVISPAGDMRAPKVAPAHKSTSARGTRQAGYQAHAGSQTYSGRWKPLGSSVRSTARPTCRAPDQAVRYYSAYRLTPQLDLC